MASERSRCLKRLDRTARLEGVLAQPQFGLSLDLSVFDRFRDLQALVEAGLRQFAIADVDGDLPQVQQPDGFAALVAEGAEQRQCLAFARFGTDGITRL